MARSGAATLDADSEMLGDVCGGVGQDQIRPGPLDRNEGLEHGAIRVEPAAFARDFYLQIDAVEQRSRQLGPIVLATARSAGTGQVRLAQRRDPPRCVGDPDARYLPATLFLAALIPGLAILISILVTNVVMNRIYGWEGGGNISMSEYFTRLWASILREAYPDLRDESRWIETDGQRLSAGLVSNWEVLAEPLQTVMRRYGIERPYEKLKELTRGHRVDQAGMQAFIDGLELPDNVKEELKQLTPATYIGNAIEQAKAI